MTDEECAAIADMIAEYVRGGHDKCLPSARPVVVDDFWSGHEPNGCRLDDIELCYARSATDKDLRALGGLYG